MGEEEQSGEPIAPAGRIPAGRLSVLAHAAVAQRIGKERRRGLFFVDGSWADRSQIASREQARANRRARRRGRRG